MNSACIVVRKAVALLISVLSCGMNGFPQEQPGFRIVVTEGEGAIHNIRGPNSVQQLRVQLQNKEGRPLPRVPVTFTAPNSGPGGSFAGGSSTLIILTDPQGNAQTRGFRPNGAVGQFPIRISARYRGETARAVAMQTNAAPAEKTYGRKLLTVALIGGAVFGAALIASSVMSSNSARQRNTPFSPP